MQTFQRLHIFHTKKVNFSKSMELRVSKGVKNFSLHKKMGARNIRISEKMAKPIVPFNMRSGFKLAEK